MNPIERMLGKGVDAGDPASLLALDAQPASDEAIDRALRARLGEVAMHPEASTPSADEVRLALHVAAAQLREQHALPAAPVRTGKALERSDHLIAGLVVHSGGWNDEARRRIASLAAARGLTQDDVLRAIAHAGGAQTSRIAAKPRDANAAVPLEERTPQRAPTAATTGPVRTMLIFASALMALAAAGMLLWLGRLQPAQSDSRASEQMITLAESSDIPASEAFELRTPSRSAADAPLPETRSVPELVERANTAIEEDPASAADATLAAINASASQWTTFTPEQIDALAGASAALLFTISQEPAGDSVLRALLGAIPPATEFSPPSLSEVIWISALLERARSDLAPPWPARITQRRASAFKSAGALRAGDRRRIWDGLFQSIEDSGRLLVAQGSDPQAWASWDRAIACVSARDGVLAVRIRLRLLDDWIRAPAFESTSAESRAALETLLAPIEFAPATEPAERLISWFDSADVPSEALHAITTHLVARSAIPEADFAWVLDPSADGRARVSRRDLFAEALRLPRRGDRGTGTSRWARLAALSLELENDAPPSASIATLARRTLLAEAAAYEWAGNPDRSQQRLDEFESGATRGGAIDSRERDDPASALTRPGRRPDGVWAARYFNAGRDIAHRIDLLNELADASQPPGAVDADVLVRAALLATPPEVRDAAARVAQQFADAPTVIYALLEDLENAPRVRSSASLVESIAAQRLPDVRDERWELEARRALVARSIGALADPRLARTDAAAIRIAESLEFQRQSLDASVTRSADTDAETDPAAAARRLADHWLQRAWRSAGDDALLGDTRALTSRRAARRAVARGPLQSFAAEYTSLAEAMALVVLAEQPTRTEQIREAYRAYERARANGAHAPAQCVVAQSLIIRLWAFRLDVDVPIKGDDA